MSKRKKSHSARYEQQRIQAKHQRQNASTEPETEVILCECGPKWYRAYIARVLDGKAHLLVFTVIMGLLIVAGIGVLIAFRPSTWAGVSPAKVVELRQTRDVLLLIVAGLMLLWSCFIALCIAVGCTSERHPFLARVLYRKNALDLVFLEDKPDGPKKEETSS